MDDTNTSIQQKSDSEHEELESQNVVLRKIAY